MNDMVFMREVAERFGCDERRAEVLTFAVFQELRDRLTPAEAADAACQLPTSLKMLWMSFYYPGRRLSGVDGDQFLGGVQRMVGLEDPRDAEAAVVCVFRVLQEALSSPTGLDGKARHIFSQLPSKLKELWLAASRDESRVGGAGACVREQT
jgi:uncharacterized protein (DUF2267 family)